MEATLFNHYIAIDWSIKNMAIARMTGKSNKIAVMDVPSDVTSLKVYLKKLEGTKVLAIEETTTSQWLYAELKDFADRIVICDPFRNRLLSEGPKTDKIDASKLVQLLKAGLLKEVYHSCDQFLYLRRLVSGYEDLVKMGTRLKNQRYALLRACGGTGKEEKGTRLDRVEERFVLERMERQIADYEEGKKYYEKEFERLRRKHPEIRHQASLPGMGTIHAIGVVARVVSPHRFSDRGHFLSYAGLIKLDRVSGGQSYGRKNPRYCRQLKNIYKRGTLSCLGRDNDLNSYYEHLIREKGYAPHVARHAAARRLAVLSWGIFKSGEAYRERKADIEKAGL